MACAKNCGKEEHCCWLLGKPCEYVVQMEDIDGKEYIQWRCMLKIIHGTWEEVYSTDEYQNNVKPKLEKIRPGMDCNDFPMIGEKCAACGSIGEEE